jgi:hypothetical protein
MSLASLSSHEIQSPSQISRPRNRISHHAYHNTALDNILSDFYMAHGKEQTADAWLDTHDFPDAHADDADDEWMSYRRGKQNNNTGDQLRSSRKSSQ